MQTVDKNKYGPSLPLLSFESSVPSRQITSSKLTMKTPERQQLRRFGIFIVNFEHILHLFLVFLLLLFEQVNVDLVPVNENRDTKRKIKLL